MVELWRLWRTGGMGVGYLPDAGGAADQACWLMDAFAEMDRIANRLDREKA